MDYDKYEENELFSRFKKVRRKQVSIAFVVVFLLVFFSGGRDLAVSLILALLSAGVRWFFFTRKLM